MRILEKIFLVLLIIVVVLVCISFFLPSSWRVERSVVINAPTASVHALVGDLKRWSEWIPWTSETDPSVVYTFKDPTNDVGGSMSWKGEKMGVGSLTLTAANPTTGIAYEMQMEDTPPAKGSISYTAESSQTKVTWVDSGELGLNPINRYFGLLIGPMLGADFDKGLAKLKQKAETQEPY